MDAEIKETKPDTGIANDPPRVIDGLLTFVGIVVLWVIIDLLLGWLKPFLPLRSLVYLSGFLTQSSIGMVIGLYLLFRRSNLKILGYRSVDFRSGLQGVIKAYLVVLALELVYGAYLVFRGYKPSQPETYRILFAQHDITFVLLNLVLAAIIAPFLEETVFRGIIFGSMRQKLGFWLSAGISAAMFSGLHFDPWGFAPRFFLGLALAYLYEKHHSLYPSIELHAVNNGLALLLNMVKLPA